MMTEEMNEQFLRFSEMLDAEEELGEKELGEDGELLLALRSVLREAEEPGLPADFTATTAAAVRERFAELPLLTRLIRRTSPVLLEQALEGRSLLKVGGLGGVGALCWSFSGALGLGFTWLVLILGLGWVILERTQAMGLSLELAPPGPRGPYLNLKEGASRLAFYGLPVLAMVGSGLVAGAGISRLAGTFSGGRFAAQSVGVLCALVTTAVLISALRPFWRVSRQRFGGRLGVLSLHHAFYLLWLGLTVLSLDGLTGVGQSSLALFADPRAWFNLDFLSSEAAWGLIVALLLPLTVLVVNKTHVASETADSEPWPLSFESSPYSSRAEVMGAVAFYLLPSLAVLASGAMAGVGVAALGELSLTFKGEGQGSALMGVLAGATTVLMLSLPVFTYLRALRDHYGDKWGALILSQCVFGLWLGFPAYITSILLTDIQAPENFSPQYGRSEALGSWPVLWTVLCLIVGSVVLSRLSRFAPTRQADLKRARAKAVGGLLRTLLPIALFLAAFYQLHLTRELSHPEKYRAMTEDVKAWQELQMAIPQDQNGFYDLKHFLLRTELEAGNDPELISKSLGRLGGEFSHEEELFVTRGLRNDERKKWNSAKSDFLKDLPLLRKALKKPHFSVINSEGFGLDRQVPNFILYRSVSQGLGVLARESLFEQQPGPATDYTAVALRWAAKGESETLISLMIEIAMLAITLEPMEQLVREGGLTAAQLDELSEALAEAQLERGEGRDVMLREIYLIDSVLDKAMNEPGGRETLVSSGEFPAFFRWLPDSYLESERKAYLNLQFSQIEELLALARPAPSMIEKEINPLNLATQALAVNIRRVQAQFMVMRSKISAHQIIVALEQHRLAEGDYPANLEALVPRFLDELPRDTAHPNVWDKKPGFRYQVTNDGYRLVSESPVYPLVGHAAKQVYGDSKYGFAMER